jgi:hypothetical protein
VQTDLTRIITTAQADNGRVVRRAPATMSQAVLVEVLLALAEQVEAGVQRRRQRERAYRQRRRAKLQQLEERAGASQ